MSPKSWFWKLTMLLILFSLSVSQLPAAFAQSEDEEPTAGGAAVEKGAVAPGESSSIDSGKNYVYLPMLQSSGAANEATAAATDAIWRTVFFDEMCSFPAGWGRYDYNGTGHDWSFNTVELLCVAQPNGYVNTMNTLMTRSFSLAGAKDARVTFRFKMISEISYDFLLTQVSCDGGASWHGTPNARSNPPVGFNIRVMQLSKTPCLKKPNVLLRFAFVTDRSVVPFGAFPPAVDYVWVEKLQ